MVQDSIGYDLLTQNALRGIIRQALNIILRDGLPGSHHFYITFDTRAEGVDLDEDLLKKFPQSMTVILEHQFWDLVVQENAFEVTLKFSGVPKYIRVPYNSVTRFHDPSVGFSLQFSEDEKDIDGEGVHPITAATEVENINWDEEVMKDTERKKNIKKEGSAKVVSLDSFRKK